MPGENLTRVEAQERKALVEVTSYDVHLDLTTGPETFRSTTTVVFDATAGSSTFIDAVTAKVHAITLNGGSVDVSAADGARIALDGLAASNTLVVDADFAYTNTGEGLHRFVDPVDDEVYLYSQFEVPDSRRVYAGFRAARPQGDVHVHRHGAEELGGRVELADPGARRRGSVGVRDHPAHLVIHHGDRRRSLRVGALRTHLVVREGDPARGLRAQVAHAVSRRRLHLRHHPQGVCVLRGEVRLPVPVCEVRPAVRSRVQRGRDGERGRRHVHRDVRVPVEGDRRDQGAPGRHDPP